MGFVAGAGLSNVDLIYGGMPRVPLEGEEQFSYPGSYQVIFELPPEWDGSATAVYHIDQSGLITRLEGLLLKLVAPLM